MNQEETIDEELSFRVEHHQASKILRLLTFIIDSGVIYLLSTRYSPVRNILPAIINLFDLQENNIDELYIYLIPAFNFCIYYFLLEVTTQQTIGKMLTRTKVFTIEGFKPTPQQFFTRTFLRMIPFEMVTFLFGYNLHDRLSKTTVARISKF